MGGGYLVRCTICWLDADGVKGGGGEHARVRRGSVSRQVTKEVVAVAVRWGYDGGGRTLRL